MDRTNKDHSPDVLGIGLCTVDMLFVVAHRPDFDVSTRASQYLRQGGGPAATAMVALARLGAQAAFIGKVGDDDDGNFIRAELEQEGVDTAHFTVITGAQTRVALVLVEEASGERGFVSRPESCGELVPTELDRDIVCSAKIVHLDDADAASKQAARWAREAGRTVVFDGTWLHEDLDNFLPLVDVAIVSEPFVRRFLADLSPEQVVKKLASYGIALAVYTRGVDGCIAYWQGQIHRFPAFSVEVVDTTGAGDAFHGAFIYGLLREWPPERIIPFASATAALNCRALGGRSALPTLAEVEAFLAECNTN
ncbi:MAG: sulfofructose kinase [Candidatus Latescibacterota bacterium]|jgi:sulfofructose kinase